MISVETHAGELGSDLVRSGLAEFIPEGEKGWVTAREVLLKQLNEEADKAIGVDVNDDECGEDYDEDIGGHGGDVLDAWEVNLGSNSEFISQVLDDGGVPTRLVETPCSSNSVSKQQLVCPQKKAKIGD
jgi:hypothetical protein